MSSVLLVKTAVCGYHVYQGVWAPARGDLFVYTRVRTDIIATQWPSIVMRCPALLLETYPRRSRICATTSSDTMEKSVAR